jgi:ketosteroid isomerase-like protein
MDGEAANGAAKSQAGSGWEEPATDPLAPLGPDFLDSEFLALWQPASPDPSGLPGSWYRDWQPPSDLLADEGLAAFQQLFWTRSGWPDGHLRAEDALAVADCLYDFIHALERFDVDAAMACVADDFHALKANGALDRQGFRHWIEELLDGLRGRQIDVSLAEVAQPVAYGRLVLCETTLQVDPVAKPGAVPSSLAFRLLLAFERDARGIWRILTSGHLDDRE